MRLNKDKERSELIEFLLTPSSYKFNPRKVTHIQTHISDVFIVSPYVYKIKKPVDFGFVNFSTLDKRRYYCGKEVELNKRLCDIYLGVIEISKLKGKYVFGHGDKTIDYAVKMKKLSDKYFLINLLKKGNVNKTDLSRVIKKLVEFYRTRPVSEEINIYGKAEKIKINIDDNISLTNKFTGRTITQNELK